MPAPTIIELTEQERQEFHRLCRSGKTPVRLKERLSIVLLADEGLTNVEIAQFVPMNSHSVARWRNRFIEGGYDAIAKNRARGATMNGALNDSYAKLRKRIIEVTTALEYSNVGCQTGYQCHVRL